MTSNLTTRLTRTSGLVRFVLCVVCAVAMSLLSSAEAFASCGDYLHSKSMRGHHQMQHDDGRAQQPVANIKQESQPSAPMRTPCNGPQCQKREPAPIAPGPVPVSVSARSTTEALLTPSIELDLVRQGVAYHEAALGASEGFVDPLDRPPRG